MRESPAAPASAPEPAPVPAPAPGRVSERDRLLRLTAGHVLEDGVAGMTLRGLGRAIGTNDRMLLYCFGSEEELITAALHEASRRFPVLARALAVLDDQDRPLGERITAA